MPLAALCLSRLTNDSWSNYAEESPTYHALNPIKPSNRYELFLERLKNSIYKRQIPKVYRSRKKESRARRAVMVPREIHFSKFFNKLYENRRNRSKRNRKYRQEKRTDYLERMGKIQELNPTNVSYKLYVYDLCF